MRRPTDTDQLNLTAIVSAGCMIAFQVGGKATRDAVFLSTFPVTALPAVLIAASAVSIVAVLVASRIITTRGPGSVIPFAFGASSILLLAEWVAFPIAPKAAAIVLYVHMAAFGATLVSGFWSIISELFDPRTAKAKIGRIAAGGTLGGLIGGLIAERTGTMFSVTAMLPVLAALHFTSAILNLRLRTAIGSSARSKPDKISDPARSGLRVLREVPYLKQLALLILLGTVAETLLDFLLKTEATRAFSQSQQLMRFFALFYTGISLLTFLVQAGFSRFSLQRFGLTGTISTMPAVIAGGGLGALIWPGLFSIGLVRGGQSVLRSSLFRSGYELLYAPVPQSEKRAAKTIVDVGFDRLGDAVGGALIRIILGFGLAASLNNRLLAIIAVVLGILSLLLTTRLNKGYVATLEKSLLKQAAELQDLNIDERVTRATMLRTLGTLDLSAIRQIQEPATAPAPQPSQPIQVESVVNRILELQSESAAVVRSALASQNPPDPILIAPVIRLLARDDVSEDAIKALRTTAASTVGQLTDALLNADEDFAIRRRLPRVLANCLSVRAVEGLMRGLADSRFEVRFSCGRALSRICGVDPALRPAPESIYAATLEEITIAQRLSETPRMLDRYEDQSESTSYDQLWNSTDIRLEHIFRLLSLSLPREPLHVAFRALHTDDAFLRGTALEYLESILPSGIRENLWQFLEGSSRPAKGSRPTDRILEELMQSRQRIDLKLSHVQKTTKANQ